MSPFDIAGVTGESQRAIERTGLGANATALRNTAQAMAERAVFAAHRQKCIPGVAVVGRLGLSYDVSLYHTQISEVADLASALPNTRIVLNHVGGVFGLGSYRSKRDEVFARWSSSIKALAARPNVFVKLGGLGQGYTSLGFDEDAEPPSSAMVAARFRPYIETCIAAFGTSRCMFESNFPVDKISYSYHVFWNACKLMAKGASSTEKADLFGGAAARCYRLNVIG